MAKKNIFSFWLLLFFGSTILVYNSCVKNEQDTVSVISISLDITSLKLVVGEYYTLEATVTPDNATDKTVLWKSSNESVASVVDGKVTAMSFGTATITAQAGNEKATFCTVTVETLINEPDDPLTCDNGVIINNVRWATRNIDAPGTFVAAPENFGMFYQWDRNIGWSSSNPMIDSNGGTTWNFTIPEASFWGKDKDPSPNGWRVPTYEELESLFDTNRVSYEWTTENGINGGRFTDITSGNSIFLPAAGHRFTNDGSLVETGSWGIYWSGTTRCGCVNARFLRLGSNGVGWSTMSRRSALSIRSVAE